MKRRIIKASSIAIAMVAAFGVTGYVASNNVVSAAEVKVTTEEELLDIISNGGEAILQNDIVMDNGITEDGQTVPVGLTVSINTNGYNIELSNTYLGAAGKLTINGGGSITASSEFGFDRLVSGFPGSDIEISSVTINANKNSKRVAYFDSSNVSINSATFTGGYNNTSDPCAGIEFTGTSETVINDATINGNTFDGKLDETKGYYDPATDIWFGAQVIATVNRGTYGDIFANQNKFSALSSHPGKVVINYGKFNKVWVEYYQEYTADVTINDGEFDNFVIHDDAKPVINGGTFGTVIAPTGVQFQQFVPSGYELVDNNDGTYTVKKIETTPEPTTQQPTTQKPTEVPTETVVVVDKKLKFQQRRTRFGYIRNKKAGRISIRISEVDTAKGYILKISTSKKFKKSKTKTVTLKMKNGKIIYTKKNAKLGTTYYLKARAYRYVNGKKVYAKWTSRRKIKIKK